MATRDRIDDRAKAYTFAAPLAVAGFRLVERPEARLPLSINAGPAKELFEKSGRFQRRRAPVSQHRIARLTGRLSAVVPTLRLARLGSGHATRLVLNRLFQP